MPQDKVEEKKKASLGDILVDIIKSVSPKAFSTLAGTEGNAEGMKETIFQKHQAATDARIAAEEAGGDGNAAFQARMGLKSSQTKDKK